MSLRLNKIGNISDALPLGTSTSYDFGSAPKAYFQRDGSVFPFFGGSFIGRDFRAYTSNLLGNSGATVNYAGGGTTPFRDGKGDYFCAGFDLASLVDPERPDTDQLIGIKSTIQVITPSTQGLAQILPMVIWTNDVTGAHRVVRGFTHLQPFWESRYTAGVTSSKVSVQDSFAIGMHGFKALFFAWFVGRPTPQVKSGEFLFKDLGLTVQAHSLKGNRPVFDPVMV